MRLTDVIKRPLIKHALAKGGETFVLEMGDPVRILDLAERMRVTPRWVNV